MADPAKTDNPPINTPFYLDKALWVTFLTPLLLILNKRFGLALDAGEIAAVVIPAASYVVMHKWKTATLQRATIAADTALAAVKDEDPAIGLAKAPEKI